MWDALAMGGGEHPIDERDASIVGEVALKSIWCRRGESHFC